MGTGSAFKRQTLQKHCPTKPHAMPKYERNEQNKPRPRFLQLVWSSASPAARPRPRSRVTKHFKNCRKRDKYHSKIRKKPSKLSLKTPSAALCAPKEPQTCPGEPKGIQKTRTGASRTSQGTRRSPKELQKRPLDHPKASPK